MIQEVEGDILLADTHAIAQGLAPNDDFKNGLAYSLRENWPSLYKDFRHFSHEQHPKEGSLWSWMSSEGKIIHEQHPKEGSLWSWMSSEGKIIFNLFTQEHAKGHGSRPGKATTSYVNNALRDLRKNIEKEKITSIALPKLSTGVGGLSWDEVLPLIEKHLGDLSIPVYLYTTYKKGVKAPIS